MKVLIEKVHGDDLMIVNAARQSFDIHHQQWVETPRGPRSRSDRQLLVDCAYDGDDMPWRHPYLTLSCEIEIPIARQLSKHQVGLSWSEVSRRYKSTNLTFRALDNEWRAANPDVRQGTGPLLNSAAQAQLARMQFENIKRNVIDYNYALQLGATPEQARYFLPLALEVRWTWSGTLLAFINLYKRRVAGHVQKECRDFATALSEQMTAHFPLGWPAMTDGEWLRVAWREYHT